MEAMESILSLSLSRSFSRMSRISRRQRNIILACCAVCAGGYVSYRVYTSSYLTRRRRQVCRFFHSLSLLLESVAQGSDCVGVVWKDLHSFLLSNEDEVPATLKQLFKVGQSREFQMSVALLCRSVTQGVVSSLSVNSTESQGGSDHGSALFEEMSSKKDGVRQIRNAGSDLGHKDGRDGHHSRKDRRWRSMGETEEMQLRNDTAIEDGRDYSSRRVKLERSESTSRNDGGEDDRWWKEKDEREGRYSSARRISRSYYSAKGNSWTAATPMTAEPVAGWDDGKGKRRGRIEGKEDGLPERLVGKLFSEAGKGFTSAVVASAARSLVLSVLEALQDTRTQNSNAERMTTWGSDDLVSLGRKDFRQKGAEKDEVNDKPDRQLPSSAFSSSFGDGVVSFLCSNEGKSLIGDYIETFIGTAVAVYLDKTRDINVYDDILSTVAKPEHREPVKELLTSVSNGAVETLIRTSHEVMSAVASGPGQSEQKSELVSSREAVRSVFTLGKSHYLSEFLPPELGDSSEFGRSQGANELSISASPPPRTPDIQEVDSLSTSGLKGMRIAFDHSPPQRAKILTDELDRVEALMLPSSTSGQMNGKAAVISNIGTEGSQGWVDGVSRTLAVPSNRALVLDVAGTVTAEAVRSAIDAVASKLSLTIRGKRKVDEPSLDAQPCTSRMLRVVNKTGELVQATAAKAMVAMTLCLAICLHTLVGPSRVSQLS